MNALPACNVMARHHDQTPSVDLLCEHDQLVRFEYVYPLQLPVQPDCLGPEQVCHKNCHNKHVRGDGAGVLACTPLKVPSPAELWQLVVNR